MDKKNIQTILQAELEKEIPSAEINLWQAVKANLVTGQTFQQGEKMNINKLRNKRISFAFVVVIVLLTLAFITPQGRAFAQNVLQFFTRAESKERALPQEQVETTEGGQSVPTAQPPILIFDMKEAEKIAGFDAKELPSVPQGFEFYGVMPIENGISIQYQAQGNGGQLIINESTSGFMQSDWDQAPEDAITQTLVNGVAAEIVQGAYVVYPNETVAKWNPDAPILRLRWIEDSIWFEMAKFGNVESISYLSVDVLITLAESLE